MDNRHSKRRQITFQKTANNEPIHVLLQRNLWPFGNRAKTTKTTIKQKAR